MTGEASFSDTLNTDLDNAKAESQDEKPSPMLTGFSLCFANRFTISGGVAKTMLHIAATTKAQKIFFTTMRFRLKILLLH